MSEKICKVRNCSMGNFILTFEEIEKGKKFELKPNGTIAIDSDELNYLTNECPNAFKMGYLEIIDLDKVTLATDILNPIVDENILTDDIDVLDIYAKEKGGDL